MPGKPGNTSALTHGMKSGTLPAGCSHVYKHLATFRGAVEAAVLAERGAIEVYEVAAIQTAESWYRHALLARTWLKKALGNLSHEQRLHFSREEARALTERDKILKQLGLDRRDVDHHSTLYTLTAIPDDVPEPETNAPAEPPA